MFHLVLRKKLVLQANRSRLLNTHFNYHLTQFFKSFSKSTNESSMTISYLIDSCGLSPESALSVAKKVHLENATNPDLVLELFQNQGLSRIQITNIITKNPSFLLSSPHKTLEPKLEFLKKVGFSVSDIAKLLYKTTQFFGRSLERHLIPQVNFLKTILHTDENVAVSIRNSLSSWAIQFDFKKIMGANIKILQNAGVPDPNISKLVMRWPTLLFRKPEVFREMVKTVVEMRFEPSSMAFVRALHMSGMTKAALEAKLKLFQSFGWSEEEFILATRNYPMCLMHSDEKLSSALDFFMNKLNLEPALLAKYSKIFSLSLNKRIIPRWTVIQYLVSKCLIKEDVNMVTILKLTDAKFTEKFVAKFEKEAPEIMKVYQGELCGKHF